jgi:hypothetical protein
MYPRSLSGAVLLGLLVSSPLSAQTGSAGTPAIVAEPAAPAATTAAEPAAAPGSTSSLRRSISVVGRDYGSLVRKRHLLRLLGGLVVGGTVANTDADQSLYDDYRDWSADQDLEDLAAAGKALGEAEAMLPLFIVPALVVGLEEPADAGALGRWWRRTARAYLVGAPPLYYLQQLTGGGRPGEPDGSHWRPFEGNHGISGHAFLGAVPFLTAARGTENRWLKAGAVALSLLPAWSRLEEAEHFPSQVALGWFLAWEATGAVAGSERRRVEVLPVAAAGGGGLAVRFTLP